MAVELHVNLSSSAAEVGILFVWYRLTWKWDGDGVTSVEVVVYRGRNSFVYFCGEITGYRSGSRASIAVHGYYFPYVGRLGGVYFRFFQGSQTVVFRACLHFSVYFHSPGTSREAQ